MLFCCFGVVFAGGGEEGAVHGGSVSPVPKFKLTAYGVHILRKDVDTKSTSSP